MKTAQDILKEKNRDLVCVAPETTIHQALGIMIENNIGAILIKKADQIIGIWTERDLMKNSIQPGFDPKSARIGDYMITGLKSAPHTDSIIQLMDKFLGIRLRHLLIEKDGKYIGLLSTGDVIKANLMEKEQELRDLNAIFSWEYYDNWRWRAK